MPKWRRKWHHFCKSEKMAKDLVSKSKNGEETGIIKVYDLSRNTK